MRAKWFFRDITEDGSEKELTQQDQFNNDEVGLAEALVRETVQNSTDAARPGNLSPVYVCFRIASPNDDARQFFDPILNGLKPHLKACDIPVPAGEQRFLLIEDFETTGLEGDVLLKDDGQFCGFWRRFGRSNKKESQGGRWGLGKLVFPSSSLIKTVIGLTRRSSDPDAYLMGQAVLRNHRIDGIERDSVGFWSDAAGTRQGVPIVDPVTCASFSRAAGLQRTSETGFSIVVPYLLPEIQPHHLIAATLRNYFYPILAGKLVVDVNDVKIDATTFDQISSEQSESIPASVLTFVRQFLVARSGEMIELPEAWQDKPVTADTLGSDFVNRLRERFTAGDMLAIRAPIKVKRAGVGARLDTHIDIFMKIASPGERAQTLVVRGSITVPTEGRKASLPDCHAALVADEMVISQLLGDAENPAHTHWNEKAEKLKLRWDNPKRALRRIRHILHELHVIVADKIDREDKEALIDFFFVAKPSRSPAGKSGADRLSLPPPKPKPFRIDRRANGFSILPQADYGGEWPLKIRLRCAYDVLSGNPFNRFSDHDFSFFSTGLSVERTNADFWPKDHNEIDVEARDADFRLSVVGFDPNRDLIIEAES